jgi:hypothetical protein
MIQLWPFNKKKRSGLTQKNVCRILGTIKGVFQLTA